MFNVFINIIMYSMIQNIGALNVNHLVVNRTLLLTSNKLSIYLCRRFRRKQINEYRTAGTGIGQGS